MPSQQQMNSRVRRLEDSVDRANDEYRQQVDILTRRKEKLRIAKEKLEYEEYLNRPGRSGENIRKF